MIRKDFVIKEPTSDTNNGQKITSKNTIVYHFPLKRNEKVSTGNCLVSPTRLLPSLWRMTDKCDVYRDSPFD